MGGGGVVQQLFPGNACPVHSLGPALHSIHSSDWYRAKSGGGGAGGCPQEDCTSALRKGTPNTW